jgi:hypothetical protein
MWSVDDFTGAGGVANAGLAIGPLTIFQTPTQLRFGNGEQVTLPASLLDWTGFSQLNFGAGGACQGGTWVFYH